MLGGGANHGAGWARGWVVASCALWTPGAAAFTQSAIPSTSGCTDPQSPTHHEWTEFQRSSVARLSLTSSADRLSHLMPDQCASVAGQALSAHVCAF